VNELSLGDGEGEASGRRNPTKGAVVTLKGLNVASVGGGGDRDHEIVHIGDYNALRRGEMGEPWGVPTATGENILGEP